MVAGGDNIFAADVNGLVMVKDTTVGTTASGFTVSVQLVRTGLNGKLIYFKLDTVNTAAITATSNNIADTTVFTLDAAYRPTELTSCVFSSNPGTGECQINPDGTVVLRTADATIAASSNIRLAHTFMKD